MSDIESLGLPASVERVRRLDVKPGETLVLSCAAVIDQDVAAEIMEALRYAIPNGVKVMFLGPGVDISVMAEAQAPYEITDMTRLEVLEALVEDIRLRVAHVTPHCRMCRSTMQLDPFTNVWICPLSPAEHPTLADWGGPE